LNPHFLFNALHTLAALVKFQPTMAENAIERLGDMLRYALKEDGRELVETEVPPLRCRAASSLAEMLRDGEGKNQS
jgi:hypothetical protein